jgi:uncharacterized protein YbjT (DUF2867 family)
MSQTFFVTGATGSQGGATARQLLAAGHKVRSTVRSLTSPKAQELSKLGATLIEGDYDNQTALLDAAQGCAGVFILTGSTQPSALEVDHVKNIVSASLKAGIPRAVLSSATRAGEHESFSTWDERNPFVCGYWRAKAEIEKVVKEAEFRDGWTVLQPAWLMTNCTAPVSLFYWAELKDQKTLLTALGKDTIVQLSAPEDTGLFAVRALTAPAPENFIGKTVRIASEEMTISEIAQRMSSASGVEVYSKIRSDEEIEGLKLVHPIVATQLWMRDDGMGVNMEEVRGYGLPLTSFEDFLKSKKPELLQALGA